MNKGNSDSKIEPKDTAGELNRGEPLLMNVVDNATRSSENWNAFDLLTKADKDRLKETAGKLNLTLVPRKIITAIARVREYGNKKYGTANPNNWKANPRQQYNEAAFRHFIAYLDDNESIDKESGLPHLHHLACNIAFLIEGGFKGD